MTTKVLINTEGDTWLTEAGTALLYEFEFTGVSPSRRTVVVAARTGELIVPARTREIIVPTRGSPG